MTVESLIPFMVALITGAAYATVWFVTKVADPTKPTQVGNFDKVAFLVTICFGAVIGVFNVWTQSPITQLGIETQLLAYGTQIAVAQQLVLTLYNMYAARNYKAGV